MITASASATIVRSCRRVRRYATGITLSPTQSTVLTLPLTAPPTIPQAPLATTILRLRSSARAGRAAMIRPRSAWSG